MAPGRRGRVSSDRGLGGDQVEGRQAVRELLIAGRRKVREVWMLDQGDDAPILEDIRELAAANRVTVTQVGRGRFFAQARCEAPQGVLALAAPLPETDVDSLLTGRGGTPPFLVALDGVTDPGNLGAVLRSAECAGVTGAILPRHRAVHVTPAATKAAAGAIEHVPMAVVGGLPAPSPTCARRASTSWASTGRRRRRSTTWPAPTGPCAWCWAPRAAACRGWWASAATSWWPSR